MSGIENKNARRVERFGKSWVMVGAVAPVMVSRLSGAAQAALGALECP